MVKRSRCQALGRLSLTLSLLFFVVVCCIRIQQFIFRCRAERLLSDVRDLAVGKSTFADAENLFKRWTPARNTGPCTNAQCAIEIALADFAYTHVGWIERYPTIKPAILRLYRLMGGRPAMVTCHVSVQNGFIAATSYAAYVEVFPGEDKLFGGYGYTLIGTAGVVQSSELADRVSFKHPHYRIRSPSACTICVAIRVELDPESDPADVRRLMQYDLSCLTRWILPCTKKGDIMPEAWQQARFEVLVHD